MLLSISQQIFSLEGPKVASQKGKFPNYKNFIQNPLIHQDPFVSGPMLKAISKIPLSFTLLVVLKGSHFWACPVAEKRGQLRWTAAAVSQLLQMSRIFLISSHTFPISSEGPFRKENAAVERIRPSLPLLSGLDLNWSILCLPFKVNAKTIQLWILQSLIWFGSGLCLFQNSSHYNSLLWNSHYLRK